MKTTNGPFKRTAIGLTLLGLMTVGIAPTADAVTKRVTTKKKAVTTKAVATTVAPATTAAPAPATTAAPSGIPATTPIALDPKLKTDPNGSIRLSFVVPPRTLDPHKEINIGQRPYWVLIYDTLFDLTQPSEARPQVALDLITAPDGLSAVMHLRTDVKFHDGVHLDASVVKTNIDRARTVAGSTAAGRINEITSVDVVDPFTVRVNLSKPLPALKSLLASGAGALIHPKAIADGRNLTSNPGDAGSGPMVATQVILENKVVYERASTAYWNPNWQRLKSAEIIGFSQYPVAANAIQSGQLELSYQNVEPQPLLDIARRAGLKKYDSPTTVMRVLFLRNTKNKFGDIRVRQALQMAIDRQITLRGTDGDCVARTQLWADASPLGNPGLDAYPYDPAKAKALLKAAGVDKLEITLATSDPNSKTIADLIDQAMSGIGVKLKIAESDTASSTLFRQGQLEAMLGAFTISLVDSVAMLDDYFLDQPGGFKAAGSEGSTLIKLRAEAVDAKSTDAQRLAAVKEIGKEMARLAVYIPICNNRTHFLATNKVVGVESMGYIWQGVPDLRGLGIAA